MGFIHSLAWNRNGGTWSAIRKQAWTALALGGKAETFVEYTATGNPLTFNTNVAKPLKQLLIPFTPVQEGSGDPSPENVRPITGWTGVTVWRTGKNLFDGEYPDITSTLVYRPLFVGQGQFTMSCNMPSARYGNLFLLPGNVSTGAITGTNSVDADHSRTTTSVNGYITIAYRSNSDGDPRQYDAQLELGTTATPYTPYTGTTKSIVFPDEVGTIYGGSLDVVSGVLTVEWAKVAVKKCTFNGTWDGERGAFWYCTLGENGSPAKKGSSGIGLCETLNPVQNVSLSSTNNVIAIYDSGIVRWVDLNHMTDSRNDYLAYLAENPILIAYQLAEPLEFQLTPQQITTLIGDNTVWSDTNGTNTAVYYKKG